ncbi:EAL domain-containing protein [Actinoplanes sp. NPDC049548]|uniref:putative bifunctional diguanylate cyclase/phosphodiesterase n=1 Tax=Actinoplanes sp. NPDC049548 TaxID=3155152 RepID=UPI00341BB23C
MAEDRRAPLRYVWIVAGLALVSSLWFAVWSTVGAGPVWIAYLTMPLGGAVAIVAVHRLGRIVRPDAVARRFWRSLLAGTGFMTVGYGLMAVNAVRNTVGDDPPDMTITSAACVALGFGLAMWAVARVPVEAGGPGERRRMNLDRTIAFLGCSTPLWYFGLAPMLTADDRWSPQTLVLIGLAFLMSVGGITKVAYLGDGPVDRTALRLVATMGLTAAGVAVLATTYGDAGGPPSQAVVLPLAPLVLVLAVRAQWKAALGRGRVSRRSSPLLPYLAVASVDLPLLGIAVRELRWTDRLVLVAAVVVSVFVIVRQFVAFRDNARLLRDIRAQEERLQHEVSHDGLTGLANRAMFRGRLQAALAAGESATVLLVDLDDFKTVNDSLGHDVGDQLLVSLAAMLREQAGDGLPVRIGGDEFAVLLVGGTTVGETVAQRILDALTEPISEHTLLVQASIGIATAEPGASVDRVLREADVAMYAAKQRGKAAYVRFLPGMAEPVVAHMRLGGELRRAVDEGELEVFYQPIMALDTRKLVGVESLVRWNHPDRGLVMPGEFIPAAERTGLIVQVGRFVLRESCRQIAAWLGEFGPDAPVKAGVNVSARQLHDPDFVADVLAALDESGLAPDHLVLELTESAVLRGSQISQSLHELDAAGVRLALDDFGTGESSLSLLRAFPAAIVKLDKSFVDGLEIDDVDPESRDARQAVARAVIQLAGALRLDSVAEGIENEAQAERLHALGYTLGQGYHLARPMSAENLTALLAAQRQALPAA